MNETVKNRRIRKIYWAITENRPSPESGSLKHFLVRDGRTNRTKAYDRPVPDAKEARLDYRLLAESDRYRLLEIELLTGRHHQIRAQLSKIGCPIRGDLKYGAPRSEPRRQHLAACPLDRVRPSGPPQSGPHHGAGTAAG